jgi:hypothetical protein
VKDLPHGFMFVIQFIYAIEVPEKIEDRPVARQRKP